jgi:hypothetical protein
MKAVLQKTVINIFPIKRGKKEVSLNSQLLTKTDAGAHLQKKDLPEKQGEEYNSKRIVQQILNSRGKESINVAYGL